MAPKFLAVGSAVPEFLALAHVDEGATAQVALDRLLEEDAGRDDRQVGIVDCMIEVRNGRPTRSVERPVAPVVPNDDGAARSISAQRVSEMVRTASMGPYLRESDGAAGGINPLL